MDRLRERSLGFETSSSAATNDREELNVKERKIELFKDKIKSLQSQLRDKERYVCDLETKVKESIFLSNLAVYSTKYI